MQNLDQRALQARDLQAVLDAADETDGVDLGSYVLQQSTYERRPRLGVSQQVFPEIVVMLLFGKVDSAVDVSQPLDNEVQRLLVVAHPAEKEDHFQHEVAFVADIIRLVKVAVMEYILTKRMAITHLF